MTPTSQRFGPDYRPGNARELRLEQHFDFAPVERPQQVRFKHARTNARQAPTRDRPTQGCPALFHYTPLAPFRLNLSSRACLASIAIRPNLAHQGERLDLRRG
jgi:hypothetical protein